MVATIILSIAVCILAEAVVVLSYTVYKIKKELNRTIFIMDELAGCVLKVAKHIPGIDVVENIENEEITFPNDEGF